MDPRRDFADVFSKVTPVKGHKLGNVHNRFLAQSRCAAWEQNISRRAGKRQVTCDGGNDNRAEAALIKGIGLNDEDRPQETGFRTARLRQVRPPNLAALQVCHGTTNDLWEAF